MVTLRLTLRQMLVRRVRTALTILAIAFAVSLVVAVTSSLASVSAVATKMIDRYNGTTDAFITARDAQRTSFPASVLQTIKTDPRVKKAVGRFESFSTLLDLQGNAIIGKPSGLTGLSAPEDTGGSTLQLVSGRWFTSSTGNEAVLNDSVARAIKSPNDARDTAPMVQPGEEITLPGPHGSLKLKVVGVVHQPMLAGQTIYIPLETLRSWVNPPDKNPVPTLTRIMVELKEGKDLPEFEKEWGPKLKQIDPAIRLRLARTNKQQSERNLMGLQLLSALGVSITLVSAACIIFSTLAMGVAERQRQLAMLRAIGAMAWQIGLLVIAEGLLLSVAGVALGVPIGYLWTKLLTLRYSHLFTEGAILSLPGVGYAAAACITTALLATLLPAHQATRVSPLEAMVPLAAPSSTRWPWRTALAGTFCLVIGPVLLFNLLPAVSKNLDPSIVRGLQFYGHFIVALPLIMAGCFLLSPFFVRLAEAALVPLMARLFAVPVALLRQQLAGGLSRAAGTACALMIGLANLVAMQVQGTSALGAWRLPDKFPDIFIVQVGFTGLSDPEIQKLSQTPGIIPGDLMPIAIASPQFGGGLLAITGVSLVPESTLFFGVDPDQALRMTGLEFRQGDPATATALIKQGKHVLITEEFRQVKDLKLGDKITLQTKRAGPVQFTIAGVVYSPGMDLVVSINDISGQFESRTAYSVFGSLSDAREYFGVRDVSIFAANLQMGVERDTITKRIQQDVGKMGLQAFDIRQIKVGITKFLENLILMASSVAFAALLVASLGVTNTVMASIRSRRWQFGVLRAVGVTRGQLLRLVLAESLLLGVAASALGLLCGFALVLSGRQILHVFIGFIPPVVIPFLLLTGGVALVLLVALLASLYPATSTSRRPILELLQAGRASA